MTQISQRSIYVVEWTHGDGMDQHQHFVEATPEQAGAIGNLLLDREAINVEVYGLYAEAFEDVLDAIKDDLPAEDEE
jgi:hypothetical protein